MKNDTAKIYGLVGKDIKQSLSPAIFSYLFEAFKINGSYHPFPVNQKDFPNFMLQLKGRRIAGLNVTSPFKEKVLNFIENLDKKASQIGAVNLIKCDDGSLCGYNSDYVGVEKTLKRRLKVSSRLGTAVLIGAGGAARACFYVLKRLKCTTITLANRDLSRYDGWFGLPHDKAETILLKQLPEYLNSTKVEVLINAASGSNSDIQECIQTALGLGGKVFDLNYHCEYRIFPEFRDRYTDGLYMLVTQAAESFRVWTGKKADVNQVHHYLAKSSGDRHA
ncbi:MAG: shikimate dehydrogenase [candidate division Zixibacteria bacterium]|nr:shikimate dehydrogenase [candidate division Zixibacteria bacterium]